MTVHDLGPLAEDRVRFSEEQDNAALHCRVEDLPEILFGLPDVLAHDTRQVVPEKVKVQVVPHYISGHGIACSARTREKRRDPIYQPDAAAGGATGYFLSDRPTRPQNQDGKPGGCALLDR